MERHVRQALAGLGTEGCDGEPNIPDFPSRPGLPPGFHIVQDRKSRLRSTRPVAEDISPSSDDQETGSGLSVFFRDCFSRKPDSTLS